MIDLHARTAERAYFMAENGRGGRDDLERWLAAETLEKHLAKTAEPVVPPRKPARRRPGALVASALPVVVTR